MTAKAALAPSTDEVAFLAGSGEMGTLIRARDWSDTPLGPIAAWTPSLRTLLGTVLACPFPMVLAWGPELIVFHNAAYRPLLGSKPDALGRPFLDLWRETHDTIKPLIDRALAGEPSRFENASFTLLRRAEPEQAYFDFGFSPIRDETGAVVGVLNTAVETTARILSERRQVFRLALEQRLRDVVDPIEAIAAASEAFGRHLGVAQVAYAEVELGGETVIIERDWNDGTMAGNRRRHRLDDYGPELIASLKRAETIAIPDVALDPRTSSSQALEAFAQAKIVGLLDVPVVKDGSLAAILGVHSETPRAWSPEEIVLAEEIAERTWAAAGRASAEAAVRESEARLATERTVLATLVEHLPVGVIVVDRYAKPLLSNPAYARIVPEAVMPSPLAGADKPWIAFDENGEPTQIDRFPGMRALQGELVHDAEFLHRAADGRETWTRVSGVPLRDTDGNVTGALGVIVDVDALKRVEAALRELNENLERRVEEALAERKVLADIVEGTDAFVQVADRDFRWLAINKAAADEFERIFRVRPKVGDSMLDLLAGVSEQQAAVRAVWSRALAGEDFIEVAEFGDPGRNRRCYEMKFNALRNAEGRQIGAYQFVYDVTERMREQTRLVEAEAARREADALYRAYFENTAEALFVIGVLEDGGFSIRELNPAHQALTGLVMDEIRGKPLEEQLPPEVAAAVAPRYCHAVETRKVQSYRESLALDGVTRHWDTVLVPLAGPDGTITQLIGAGRDVTAQIQAEDALRQAQKMEAVGQLTGGIAHDFNNLLGAVVGALDLIRRKPDDVAKVKRYAEAGLKAAERGAKLTGQLLAFSRSQRIELKPVVVADLVTGMRDLLASTLGPMVRLKLELDGDGAVLSDPTQLEMAVLNLAINARDAMQEGGDLTIAAATRCSEQYADLKAGDYVELSISDTGSGMPPEVAARAFDPFFTTKGVGKGTGLGLSQVYGIARQAGGTARIDSRTGVGTTVRMYLPKSDAPVPACAMRDAEAGQVSAITGTVLVIDDDPDVRRMILASLDALGYRTLEAEDGRSGLTLLETEAPDLLMVDFAMPGMNGAEVAKLVKERRPDLPIVFASGYADTAAIEAAAGSNVGVLRKPFRVADLEALLAKTLNRRH